MKLRFMPEKALERKWNERTLHFLMTEGNAGIYIDYKGDRIFMIYGDYKVMDTFISEISHSWKIAKRKVPLILSKNRLVDEACSIMLENKKLN
jgi:hypothetical protein